MSMACTCVPCERPGYGALGWDHCAGCCSGTFIEQYDERCPVDEHRVMARRQFGLEELPPRGGDGVSKEPELMSGCETCGYVGGVDMLACDRHCRPCHIHCRCPRARDQVLELAAKLRDVPGYAGTRWDPPQEEA